MPVTTNKVWFSQSKLIREWSVNFPRRFPSSFNRVHIRDGIGTDYRPVRSGPVPSLDGAIAPPSRKSSRFFPAKANENKFILLWIHLKMCFLPMIAPPFQNTRFAAGWKILQFNNRFEIFSICQRFLIFNFILYVNLFRIKTNYIQKSRAWTKDQWQQKRAIF
jgi:hypothetical protein